MMIKKVYISVFLVLLCSLLRAQVNEQKEIDSLVNLLHSDSTNYSANYNLGMFYYEEAVKIIQETSYETDLITLDAIQNETVALFQKAIPYLERAYRLNPSKKEIFTGLSALYFSLNELDKVNELERINSIRDK